MKIVIVGAGAMGSLFAGLLTGSGRKVHLLARRKEQVEAILSNGLIIEEKEKRQIIQVAATADASSLGKADLVLFFVKTYQTERAVVDALVLEKEDTLFLSLQNGLNNEDTICKKIDRKKLLLGVTGQGATLLGLAHIRHAGWGDTKIGELEGEPTDRTNQIAQIFREAGIPTSVSSDIHAPIWEKLLINVGINALTALTSLKNGQLLDHPETLRLMEVLVFEAAEVAKRKGIRVERNVIEKVRAAARVTGENRSSMGQDFDFKRRTEIDAINGAVVKEAKLLGISVPYNQTVTDLVKAIEKSFYYS